MSTKKLTYEFVKLKFEDMGFTLLETSYQNSTTKMKCVCKLDHISYKSYSSVRTNRGCLQCGFIKTSQNRTYSHEYVENFFKESGCILLSHYTRANIPIEFVCKCGNKYQKRFADFIDSKHCKKCGFNNIRGKNNYQYKEDTKQFESFKLKAIRILTLCKIRKTNKGNEHDKNTIGYTHDELWSYLKSHLNWDSTKDQKWHIDHIFPYSAFWEFKILDVKIIHNLDNLQPISDYENRIKSNRYNPIEFQAWLKTKGIEIDISDNSI